MLKNNKIKRFNNFSDSRNKIIIILVVRENPLISQNPQDRSEHETYFKETFQQLQPSMN